MAKKVLIITTSLRNNSNSDKLAESFIDRRNISFIQKVLGKMSPGDNSIGKVREKLLIVNGIAAFSQQTAHFLIPVDPCVCEFPEFINERRVSPIYEQTDDMDISAPVLCGELDARYDFRNEGGAAA